jgi:glutathione S-transferase
MSMILFELRGLNDLRYSQFAWRSRLALAHKGLTPEYCGVRVSDKATIAFSKQDKVPILRDGEQVIADSWRIAEYLEAAYPDRPSLFGGPVGQGLARLVNAWVDRQIIPAVAPLVVCDLPSCVDEQDGAHLRAHMEKAFGVTLEEMRIERTARLQDLRRHFDAPRTVLKTQPYLSGASPAYADYVLFSVFQWARLVCTVELLAANDLLAAWRDRMLDLFDGLARSAPARSGAGA